MAETYTQVKQNGRVIDLPEAMTATDIKELLVSYGMAKEITGTPTTVENGVLEFIEPRGENGTK